MKLVDPSRIFDAKGRSLDSYEVMEKRILFLEHQLARLMRILRGQSLRNGSAPLPEHPPVLH
jgi:hypothetical protein